MRKACLSRPPQTTCIRVVCAHQFAALPVESILSLNGLLCCAIEMKDETAPAQQAYTKTADLIEGSLEHRAALAEMLQPAPDRKGHFEHRQYRLQWSNVCG